MRLPKNPAFCLRLTALAVALAMPLTAAQGRPAVVASTSVARATDPTHRLPANVALDEARNPAAVLGFVGVKAGQAVADYSAGGGYYSEMLATLVGPRGTVYAMTSPRYYKADAWAPILAAHPNVRMLVQPDDASQLAPNSVDLIFTHLVFHDLFLPARAGQPERHPDRVIANWFSALHKGGRVIIADHVGPAGDVSAIAGKLHRIDPQAARSAMEAAGFVLEAQSAVLHQAEDDHTQPVFAPGLRGHTDRFLMIFRKP